jgi:cupin fold WbuC family metalloprotein
MRELNEEVLVADDPLTFLTGSDLVGIAVRARSATRKRARILLHSGPSDVMQQMMIVMTRGQYVPPHWNGASPKSYLVMSGSVELIEFDTSGHVNGHFRLTAGEPGVPFFARMNRPMWHTCVAVTPDVTFLEASLGPYEKTVYADWAPAADDQPAARRFFQQVCDRCGIPAQ